MSVVNTLQQTLGEGQWAVQRGTFPKRIFVNCEICRSKMSTDGLLNKLRCAECRQLSCDRVCAVVWKISCALCFGSALLCLVSRWAKQDQTPRREPASEKRIVRIARNGVVRRTTSC